MIYGQILRAPAPGHYPILKPARPEAKRTGSEQFNWCVSRRRCNVIRMEGEAIES